MKFDTTISVQHLLTALMIAGALITWAMRMEGRLTTLESGMARQAEVEKRQDAEKDRLRAEIREDLRAISEKLDRLVERR